MTESSKYPDRIISGDEHALVIAILRGYPPCIARNDALRAMDEARFLANPDPSLVDVTSDKADLVRKALRRAWQLGQTYWQQADRESLKQQAKSDQTLKAFNALIEETCDALTGKDQP